MPDPDNVVVVTGGARGIGRATAKRLAKNGNNVVIIDIDEEEAQQSVDEVRSLGGRANFFSCDVSEFDKLQMVAKQIESDFGPCNQLVTCAGICETLKAEEISFQNWNQMISVNLSGTFFSAQLFGRQMLANNRGSMVLVGSKSGLISNKTAPHCHYNSSKAAVIHLSRCLAAEWASQNVKVNCISPGYILTPMTEGRTEEHIVWVKDIPVARLGETKDVVGAIEFLLGEDAQFISGHNLVIDGGYTLW